MTERASFHFKVSDIDATRAWVSTEPMYEGLPTLNREKLSIGFDLNDESYKSAQEVADFLNKHIKNIVIW